MKNLLPYFLLLLGCTALLQATPLVDPVFPDVKALYSTPVNARVMKTSESAGIVTEEVIFHVEMDGEQSVDTFGYFLYPVGAKGLPAVIWNQSGLAPADVNIATYGAQRGYAMLCFDYPCLGDEYRSTVKYSINSTLELTDDIKKAPIAHGATAALKAVSFLQTRTEVDPERIGMAGNSWGGFFSTLMAGLDPRLKACAASFGTGGLQLGCAWFVGAPDPAIAERWGTTLDPAWRLAYSKTPMLWVSATNDTFYWMPGLMRSYALAAGPKHLSIAPNWDHSAPNAFSMQFDWLDIYLQGKPSFIEVSPITLRRKGRLVTAQWTFSASPEQRAASAELALSYGSPGNWRCRYWRQLPAIISGTRCTVRLPESPLPYFIYASVIDANGLRHSTPLLQVEPKDFRLFNPRTVMPIDGCEGWGDFEGEDSTHEYPMPEIFPEAKRGKSAAVLPAEQTTSLMRIYFIAGLTHRLNCYMKAKQTSDVIIKLTGYFDRITRSEERIVTIGTDWTPVTLDFPTSQALYTALQLSVTTPPGEPVLMDELSFRPLSGHTH